jgi:hypothetical protein
MVIYWKNHVSAYTGAQKFWIPGVITSTHRVSVTSEAPAVTLMSQLRSNFRRVASRVFGRVN